MAFQGCPERPDQCYSRRVSVQAFDNFSTYWYTATLDEWGETTVTVPVTNTELYWYIKPNGALAERAHQFVECPPCKLPVGWYAEVGDINEDNRVTIQDFTLLKANFGHVGVDPWP